VSGTVVNAKTKEPVPYAAVALGGGERWTVCDEKGAFVLKNVPGGEATLTVACLGYAKHTATLALTADVPALRIALAEDNLQLAEVVVSARPAQEATSSYLIDRASLEHLQMLNVSDAMSLLPGGQTNRNLHLATSAAHYVTVRSTTNENGNPTFGTAVEVDGVRLAEGNAEFNSSATGRLYGVDTRSIASSNVESVEVVTGMPSVQYGDLTNGMVKVNTVRGQSPLHVEASTRPNTKQVAAHKGFALGRGAGVLNAGVEHTLSVSDLASPYTSYTRNGLSLRYTNTFGRDGGRPLTVEAGVSGNVGGYHSKGDPDAFVDTYTRRRSNTLRTNVRLAWQPDRRWLTSIETSASLHYVDNLAETRVNRSTSSTIPAIHGCEEGYFVAMRYDDDPGAAIVIIPPGSWYQTELNDSRPLNLAANLKGNWERRVGRLRNQLMVGIDFTSAGNLGRGVYYDDLRYAPSGWREYRYDCVPFMNNAAWYVENKAQLPVGATRLQAVAGLRSDITFVAASRYGTVSSLSPRFSARWTLIDRAGSALSRLVLTGGWGKAVKLPSFEVLYPRPAYTDRLSFAPGAMADGTTFYAYHIMPHTPAYNPDLRWQQSRQWEAGLEATVGAVSLSVSLFRHQTIDPYIQLSDYTPFAYKMTGQSALEGSAIASADRIYSIDRATGIVTVIDRTGTHPAEVLPYSERRTFRASSAYANGTPFVRRGVEWVVDFGRIPLLQTTVRFDGSYYHYRSTEETIEPYALTSQTMPDGNPYKYVGYYVGGHASANGSDTRTLNVNLWLTTHLPALRLIFSLRLEACLYNYAQNLSEFRDAERGFALDSRSDYTPAADPTRYNTSRYVALYPLYYTTYEDMETRRPFAETFLWARENDPALYNALAALVQKSNTDYYFNARRLSAYYALNLSVTKELGDVATLSFAATNFTNNSQRIVSSDSGSQVSIYQSSYIPRFYYSLSLKIKL
jgi:outer membrane cobalamin receptor